MKEEKNLAIKNGYLLFSNSVEVLFEHLKANLFSEDRSEDVFSEKLLITPSQGMKEWIQTRLADSLSISSGWTHTFLDNGVNILLNKIFYTQVETHIPTKLELLLCIDREIENILDSQEPIWQPLIGYLQKKESRKISLVHYLAQLFEQYGIYGGNFCKNWETGAANWQQELWKRVFSHYDYPIRQISRLKEKADFPKDLSVHLFAFSHISPLYFHFLCRVSQSIPVYFYHLSPCQEFWSTSDVEHPALLSQLGKVGRETARLTEEKNVEPEMAYVVFGGDTQLKQVQRDLLFLQNSKQVLDDDSIQIHISSTPQREIENLFALLTSLFATARLDPKDIIVMAPQIGEYAPYIKAIFGKTIPYRIADLPLQTGNSLEEGLFLLLDLENKRWSAPAVLQLLAHPLFLQKLGLSEADLLVLRNWIKQMEIRWGIDQSHRVAVLEKNHCGRSEIEGFGTWMEGLGRLLEELALPHVPARISYTEAELLGTVLQLLCTLRQDLQTLEVPKTLQEWSRFISHLSETYFGANGVLPACEEMQKYDKQKHSFSFFYALLKDKLKHESVTINRNACQAVHFCSMLPMRAIPAKVICLLGMNHDTFPRSEQLQNLDFCLELEDYCPTRVDFDRYLFLEAILSAREKFIVSYLGINPLDLTELPPSSAVSTLLPFVSKSQIYTHPVHHLESVQIQVPKVFSTRTVQSWSLPRGTFTIDISDLLRLVKSGLKHYLYCNDLKLPNDELIEAEEPFILTPLKKAILTKQSQPQIGAFPLGMFGTLAFQQLQQERDALQQFHLEKIDIVPLSLPITSSCTVTLTGSIEGVYDSGLFVSGVCSLTRVVKVWPLFLALHAIDKTKNQLRFANTNEAKTCFFEDPVPLLHPLIEYYFYAKEYPVPLCLEWIEPILKRDGKKLGEVEVYDPILKWQLMGIDTQGCLEACSFWVEKLYREMADAWF